MKAKRFFSVLVALMLVMSCFAISASAETKPTTGNLVITLSEGTKGNETDDHQTGTTGDVNAENPLGTRLEGVTLRYYRVADDEINNTAPAPYTENDEGTVTTASDSSGVISLDNLPAGRYFVKQENDPTYLNGATMVSFLVDVPMTNVAGTGYLETTYVYPKIQFTNDPPTVEKQVKAVADTTKGLEGSSLGNSAALGTDQKAEWQIDITVPTDIVLYSKFEVSDHYTDGLSYVTDSMTIKEGSTVIYDKDNNDVSAIAKLTSVVEPTTKSSMKVVFVPGQLTAGSTITITYQTTITNNTPFVKYANHVDLKYNNKPASEGAQDTTINNHDDGSEDPRPDPDPDPTVDPNPVPGDEKDPYVYTGALEIEKVDERTTSTVTQGTAIFNLYADEECTILTAENLSTTNGLTETINGLKPGKIYYIVETQAPAGYELNPNKVPVTIPTEGTAAHRVTFADIESTKLPLTGGTGVVLFAVLGLALAALGVSLLKSKRYE